MPKTEKRGRPATGRDPLVAVRMPPALTQRVDEWAAAQQPPASRSDAIRQLVERGLAAARGGAGDGAAAPEPPPAAMNEETRRKLAAAKAANDRPTQRADGAARAKELAVGAVKDALARVEAPTDEKIERARKLVKRPPGLERK